MSRTAIFVSNRSYGMIGSRLWLVERFVAAGWQVVLAGAKDETVRAVSRAGAEFVEVPFRRGGIDLLSDFAAWRVLRRLYLRRKPRLVWHINTKPILIGGLAAATIPGVTLVNTVTGLGYGLTGARVVASVLRRWYRAVLPRAAATIFQNPDDRTYFTDAGLIAPERAYVIASSGVKTDHFHPAGEGEPRPVTVLLVGRLVWQKGVREYAEAARRVRAAHPDVRFLLAGEADPDHPDAVPQEWLRRRVEEGTLEHLGYVRDMHGLLSKIDLLVAPSTFREGFPRVLLEAASCGVPAITTDLPGCREGVREGETGFIVPPGDVQLLADAIARLVADTPLRHSMGGRARRMAIEEFDRRIIIDRTLEALATVGIRLPPRKGVRHAGDSTATDSQTPVPPDQGRQ